MIRAYAAVNAERIDLKTHRLLYELTASSSLHRRGSSALSFIFYSLPRYGIRYVVVTPSIERDVLKLTIR